MWRLWIVCMACGGGSAPIARPVAPLPVARPVETRVPANQMLARVGFQNTNTWIDIAIDGTGPTARDWCEEMVNRFVKRRVDPLKPVVERACEATQLPRPQRRGFAISQTAPLDILEQAIIGTGSAPEPPTGTTTHVSQFTTLEACERERVRVVDEQTKSDAEAAAAKRSFVEGQLAVVEQRAKQTCDQVAARKQRKPCRATDRSCLDDQRRDGMTCDQERQMVDTLKQHRTDPPSPPAVAPPCVELKYRASAWRLRRASHPGRAGRTASLGC
jgi:hypothetical protein